VEAEHSFAEPIIKRFVKWNHFLLKRIRRRRQRYETDGGKGSNIWVLAPVN
jgi:hypothetical protein